MADGNGVNIETWAVGPPPSPKGSAKRPVLTSETATLWLSVCSVAKLRGLNTQTRRAAMPAARSAPTHLLSQPASFRSRTEIELRWIGRTFSSLVDADKGEVRRAPQEERFCRIEPNGFNLNARRDA